MSEIPMYPDECAHRREPSRCWECLTTILVGTKSHAQGLADLAVHLQSELDRERGRADHLREALHQAYRYIRDGAPAAALSLIDATVGQP